MKLFDFFKSLAYKRPENTGVLLGNNPEDYFAGANSPIIYKKRLESGDWTPYCLDEEPQYSNKGDSMACVSHSVINAIQAQEYFLTGKKVNYSKRWLAKMSGTTRQGNYLNKVADTIRQYGLVLEEDYPAPSSFTWDEYHSNIPEPLNLQLLKKGQEWFKKWDFAYEFLQINDANLDYHLKHSPIQIVIPGHAVCGIYSPDMYITYRDSYPQYNKKYAINGLLSAMKPILTPTTLEAGFVKWNNHPEVWFMAKMDSMQRMEKFKNFTFDGDYSVKEDITILPTKKPF